MSKRVWVILGIGFACIIAAVLLLNYELTTEPVKDMEPEPAEDPEPVKEPVKQIPDEPATVN